MKLQDGGRNKVYYDENTKQHVLCIKDIKPKDAGTYTVTVSNEHGSEQAPATLMVTDKLEEVLDWKAQLKHRLGILSCQVFVSFIRKDHNMPFC